jgi:hypothetical protein
VDDVPDGRAATPRPKSRLSQGFFSEFVVGQAIEQIFSVPTALYTESGAWPMT